MSTPTVSQSHSGITRRVSAAFGIDDASREAVLAGMLAKPREDAPLYWLELALSTGIATLGLVLNSVAVIIGAMLIAPLMTPIIELSMGVVVLSSRLILHGLLRVVASVALVVGGAAAITLLLPFREPTTELLARTAPTALDLFVAICCALAAAITTLRPHAGASSTAAGTAIGISLVPPLCASGFGVGAREGWIAEGALLLFVANFTAILTFASLFFALVGFDPRAVPAGGEGAPLGPIERRLDTLAGRFAHGPLRPRGAGLRLTIPLLLLAAVFVPLQRALGEVSQEVRLRAAVTRLVAAEPLLADALQMTTDVQRGGARVNAVVVGTDRQALELEGRLRAVLVGSGAVDPLVRVRAVPSASLLPREAPRDAVQTDPLDLVSPARAAERVTGVALASLRRRWPTEAGRLADAWVELRADTALAIVATAIGPPPPEALRTLLATVLAEDMGHDVTMRIQRVPAQVPETDGVGVVDWWAEVDAALRVVASTPVLRACLGMPPAAVARRSVDGRRVRDLVLAAVDAGDGRVEVDESASAWQARFAAGACRPPAP